MLPPSLTSLLTVLRSPIRARTGGLLLAALALGPGRAGAQIETARLSPPAPVPEEQFAYAVDVEGDVAVLGRPSYDSRRGRVIVYRRGDTWTPQQDLDAEDGLAGDLFGLALALQGDRLLIGASGKAYVFAHDGQQWVQEQQLSVPGIDASSFYGLDVALDGSTAVVGAMKDSTMAADAGAAYVFTREAAGWVLQQRLVLPDARTNDFAGRCALSGDTILIGAWGRDDFQGVADVFRRSNGSWQRVQRLTAENPQPLAVFGLQVAIDGGLAAVSEPFRDINGPDVGALHVYRESLGTWSLEQSLLSPSPHPREAFGSSFAITHQRIVVGLQSRGGEDFQEAAAWLFERDFIGWKPGVALTPRGGSSTDFTRSVAVSGTRILLGSPLHDRDGENVGTAHEFLALEATPQTYNGSGINVDRLSAGPIEVGRPWTATAEVVAAHGPGIAWLAIHESGQSGIQDPRGRVEFLVGGFALRTLGPLAHGGQGTTATFTTDVPATPALVGLVWTAQAALLSDRVTLTHALAGRVR